MKIDKIPFFSRLKEFLFNIGVLKNEENPPSLVLSSEQPVEIAKKETPQKVGFLLEEEIPSELHKTVKKWIRKASVKYDVENADSFEEYMDSLNENNIKEKPSLPYSHDRFKQARARFEMLKKMKNYPLKRHFLI